MNENTNDQKLTDRVRKLLDKAQAVAGTPEADVLNAKAFELIAQYGLDAEVIARRGIDKNIEDTKLIAATFTFSKYTTQRIELLWAIAQPLHCAGIVTRTDGKIGVKLFGVARHIRRVKLLHGFLSAQMLAGAARAVPNTGIDFAGGNAVEAHRQTWMKGFADGVMAKINEVEQAAIRQFDRNCGDTRMAVARMNDFERAQNALHKAFPTAMFSGKFQGTGYGSGYAAGNAAGRQSDVGQTRVGAGGQRAIS